MTRNMNLREKYLDGEKLFRKYYEMGEGRSVKLLTEWAISVGMASSTGNLPTAMGVWKSMWRWASLKENCELAWDIVQGKTVGTAKNRFVYDRKRWEWEMINIRIPSAWQHATQHKKELFMKENGWV